MTTLEEHKIELTSEEPMPQKPYPIPYALRRVISEEVKKMLDAVVIERADSSYVSPVVMVKKDDGTIRFCIDFRKLNKINTFDGEPMPT